jgi:fructose-1,6-bisphosphatase/inositol monophosphatase family enzyme
MDATAVAHANPFAIGALALDSVQVALGHVDDYVTRLEGFVAQHGTGDLDSVANAATRDARIGAFRVNKDAQARIRPLFEDAAMNEKVRSLLTQADASLEDSAWQIQNKDSPDGRFIGIDLGGALDDARDAATALREILQ